MTAYERVVDAVKGALITAVTTFRDDQYRAYQRAIERETNPASRWAMEAMLENAKIAAVKKYPLCDDTGIPHLYVEVGTGVTLTGELFAAMREGVAQGQRAVPTRPMGLVGDDDQRVSQSGGVSDDPAAVVPPNISLKVIPGNELRITVLMLGGGPELRATTLKIHHERSVETVIRQAGQWAVDVASKLGCTPMVPLVGIGRTHYEATSMMLEAMKDANFDQQNQWEQMITDMVNASGAGSLSLQGSVTALGSFIKVGPQRASGQRMVCMRPGCSVDVRRGTAVLTARELLA
jgi:fumarate hydratase subunit alpha